MPRKVFFNRTPFFTALLANLFLTLTLTAWSYPQAATSSVAEKQAPDPDRKMLEKIANGITWRRLLHYNRFLPWSATKGEVDGQQPGAGFYLAKDGEEDPLAELVATLKAFKSRAIVGNMQQPAPCAFPERYRFLKRQEGNPGPLAGDNFDFSTCTLYNRYAKEMEATATTLVFSSAYSSNPGSMFGHTILKFSRKPTSDLLDLAVSFAAQVDPQDNALFYFINGLTGGYPANFSFQFYYKTVNAYINAESRDLWEYRLNFTPDETESLINHLWELESNSWFNYYFLNKNCSFQLLTVLEVVKPDWDLSSGWYFVVPAETVKRVLEIPGSVTSIRYRPSLRKKLKQSVQALTADQQHSFSDLMAERIQADTISSPDVLSTATRYIQFVAAESPKGLDPQKQKLWKKILRQLSLLPKTPDNAPPSPPTSSITAYEPPPQYHPEDGHGPTRVSLTAGVFHRHDPNQTALSGGFQEFMLRPAYHDLLSDDRGYLPFSEINFPNFTLRYYPQTGLLNLENFQFFSLTSLSALSLFETRFSWKVRMEIQSPKDLLNPNAHVLHAETEWGGAVNIGSEKSIAYGLLGGYLDIGSGLGRFFRFGPAFELGFLTNPWDWLKIALRSTTYGDLLQARPYRSLGFEVLELSQAFSWLPRFDLRLIALTILPIGFGPESSDHSYEEGKISLSYFF
jgi:hypothetical protein